MESSSSVILEGDSILALYALLSRKSYTWDEVAVANYFLTRLENAIKERKEQESDSTKHSDGDSSG